MSFRTGLSCARAAALACAQARGRAPGRGLPGREGPRYKHRAMKPAVIAAFALSLVACNKPGGAPGGQGEGAKKGGPPADRGGPVSAEKGATPGATRVTECPKSLGGAETQIDRVISRDCGPVVVTENYSVDGGSLTLEAGATLQFKDGAGLIVGFYEGAKLIVQGTPEAPVTFTSAGDKAGGAWRGIELQEKAARSTIAGAVIEYAGDEERALLVAAEDVSITGSTIREAKGPALRVVGAGKLAAFTGNALQKLGAKMAIFTTPQAAAGIAAGNKFDGGAVVVVGGGTLAKSATWANPGVPLLLAEVLGIDGEASERATLTLSPGTEMRLGPEGRVIVGFYGPGGLKAVGSAEGAITFTSAEKHEPGAWSGIEVASHGEAEIQRAAFEFGGLVDDTGVLTVREGALSLREVTFRSNRAGVVVSGEAAKLTAFADNKFAATPRAIDLPAALVGALGEGNAFDSDARILVQPGTVKARATWLAQGAPLELLGTVNVDGAELTLDAGLRLLARPDARLEVGFYETATLLAKGTAASPITFTATAGSWHGVGIRSHALRSALEYVTLSEVAEDQAVWVDGGVEAKLDNVTCSKCQKAVVGWACGARVSSAMVAAVDGTPAIENKPEGC